MSRKKISLFDRSIAGRAAVEAFRKLDPRLQLRNPVMFVVFVGEAVAACAHARGQPGDGGHAVAEVAVQVADVALLHHVGGDFGGLQELLDEHLAQAQSSLRVAAAVGPGQPQRRAQRAGPAPTRPSRPAKRPPVQAGSANWPARPGPGPAPRRRRSSRPGCVPPPSPTYAPG